MYKFSMEICSNHQTTKIIKQKFIYFFALLFYDAKEKLNTRFLILTRLEQRQQLSFCAGFFLFAKFIIKNALFIILSLSTFSSFAISNEGGKRALLHFGFGSKKRQCLLTFLKLFSMANFTIVCVCSNLSKELKPKDFWWKTVWNAKEF
jgi:hypothetical protein